MDAKFATRDFAVPVFNEPVEDIFEPVDREISRFFGSRERKLFGIPILMSGWLQIPGMFRKKNVWVVLHKHAISWFKSAEKGGTDCQGIIPVGAFSNVDGSLDIVPERITRNITLKVQGTRLSSLQFQAQSTKIADLWVREISCARSVYYKSGLPFNPQHLPRIRKWWTDISAMYDLVYGPPSTHVREGAHAGVRELFTPALSKA